VARVVVNRQRTGAIDRDGRPGFERLRVALEARNTAGQSLRVPGDVTLEVVDPSAHDQRAPLARWHFTPEQSAQRLVRDQSGERLQFELPWKGGPETAELELRVRFTTPSGRSFTTRAPLETRHQAPAVARSRPAATRPLPLSGPVNGRPAPRSVAGSAERESWTPIVDRPHELPAPPDDEASEPAPPDRTAGRPQRPEWRPYR
jgi:hypothetical protein